MASQLGIQVGPLSSVRNYTDDTMVQRTLLDLYEARSLGPLDATNQQKLDAVVQCIEEDIRQAVWRHRRRVEAQQAEDQIQEEYDLA